MNTKNSFHFYKGRVALHAILKVMGVGLGDEIIVPGFTCLGVPLPILNLGAKPVYADIESLTYNIAVDKLERLITPRTKAIIAQHTFGVPVDMDPLLLIAKKYHLYVIEDCCHTFNSKYKGKLVGTFGHAAFYSYEWGKPVILGGGGSAVLYDKDLIEKMNTLYGSYRIPDTMTLLKLWLQRKAYSVVFRPSLFWRLRTLFRFLSRFRFVMQTFTPEEIAGEMVHANEQMAPFLKDQLAQKLKQLDENSSFRRKVTDAYEKELSHLGIESKNKNPDLDIIYLRYPIKTKNREKILSAAKAHQIEIGDWFLSPVHPLTETAWKIVQYEKGSCPVAEAVSQSIVTLPIYNRIGPKQIQKTARFLEKMRAGDII